MMIGGCDGNANLSELFTSGGGLNLKKISMIEHHPYENHIITCSLSPEHRGRGAGLGPNNEEEEEEYVAVRATVYDSSGDAEVTAAAANLESPSGSYLEASITIAKNNITNSHDEDGSEGNSGRTDSGGMPTIEIFGGTPEWQGE